MNEKLVRKYIPKKYRDVEITHDFGGMRTAQGILRGGGKTRPAHDLTVTPIRGQHQGWSSHTDIFSVGMPSGDSILVSYPHGSLQGEAKVHISGKTGVCTVMSDFSGSQFNNKTWSELFGGWVRHNATKYPYAESRIGDTQIFEGLQFKASHHDIEALNPRKDFRPKTNRAVSMPVRRELLSVANVVEGKAMLLRGAHTQDDIAKMAVNMCENQRFKSLINAYWGMNTHLSTMLGATEQTKEPLVGKKLKLVGVAEAVYDATGGNPAHVLMSLIMAKNNTANHLIDYAPMWIAARGGYELGEV